MEEIKIKKIGRNTVAVRYEFLVTMFPSLYSVDIHAYYMVNIYHD